MKKGIIILGFLAALVSLAGSGLPVKGQLEAGEKRYRPGDRGPGGGWVFFDKGLFEDGWRYLEAAPSDLDKRLVWGCVNTYAGASRDESTDFGEGQKNTLLMLKSCREKEAAAQLCSAYREGGKSDWFLPSLDELEEMYLRLHMKGIGNFEKRNYWSSSQVNARYARLVCFNEKDPYHIATQDKDVHLNVRPVRAF